MCGEASVSSSLGGSIDSVRAEQGTVGRWVGGCRQLLEVVAIDDC